MDEGYPALAIGQQNAVLIKTPFINAKRLSDARSTLLWHAANKTPFTVFSTVRRYNGNGNFSMTPTVRVNFKSNIIIIILFKIINYSLLHNRGLA